MKIIITIVIIIAVAVSPFQVDLFLAETKRETVGRDNFSISNINPSR